MLIFDEEIMTFAMGNCIVMEDTNGNRKLLKKRNDQKLTPSCFDDGCVYFI